MSDLGNISNILAPSVPNLDWLDVDEKEYQKLDTLPKQNLDILPDLQNLWSHQDSEGPHLIPNRAHDTPKTMGDLSQEHGFLRSAPEEIRKFANLVLMQSTDIRKFKAELLKRFDRDSLREARSVLASALEERGLIGKIYINANDFTSCDKGTSKPSKFVQRFAKEALFVVAKPKCAGCVHAKDINGASVCSVFHKEIRVEVPYTKELASKVEASLRSRGKDIKQSSEGPKKRIRLAVLSDDFKAPNMEAFKPKENTTRLLASSKGLDYTSRADSMPLDAKRIVSAMRKEMIKGRSTPEIISVMKSAFKTPLLEEHKAHWAPVLKEAGLYGVVYSSQDLFQDCREGASFLSKHASHVQAIVVGAKCTDCTHNKVSHCGLYGKALVQDPSELLTTPVVASVLKHHMSKGRIASVQKQDFKGKTPLEALRMIHKAAHAHKLVVTHERLDIAKNNVSVVSSSQSTRRDVKRSIVIKAKELMNKGFFGKKLIASLKHQFDTRDLITSKLELKQASADQGLQGRLFIDPSIYTDYGHGCKKASDLFRASKVRFVKKGSKCDGCVYQTSQNHCAAINKKLASDDMLPKERKLALQRSILASDQQGPLSYDKMEDKGSDMMSEFELEGPPQPVDLDVSEYLQPAPFDVTFDMVGQKA
jgi:hypothetical protein